MQILIVDDDDFALNVLDKTLTRMGYTVLAAHNGKVAMEVLRRGEIRLVITDWDMPEMNGVDLCRAVRKEDLSGYVYIIMLTGREGARERMAGLCAGADDFLNKPLDPEELLVCLKTSERILALETRDVALFALAKLAESRDSETGAHVERVQSYTRLLAQHLSEEVKACYGVDDEYIRLLHQTSPLHDLGKVGIPDAVLLKPGKLTPAEFAIMKTHTLVGAQTLDAALQRFPNARFLQIAREIAISHHERFDGSGYPKGLAGEQIPLCGRIVAVADVYDALTSRRVYKAAMTHEEAKAIIQQESGRHFDPEIVAAFLRAEKEVLAARQRLRDADADAAVVEPVPIPAPPPPELCGPSPCKLLVADDDPVLRAQLVKLLAATGEVVITAADGLEALTLIEEHNPRVVISDWDMPRMNGVELCRRIRARLGAPPIHMIMLTAHTDKSKLLDAYNAGIDDFVSKPFDAQELLARVRAGLRAARLHDELLRKASGSQALTGELATLNSRLERLSITDELTGLFNRRHAMSRLEETWNAAERGGRALTIAMVDIDHFKRINDSFGHDAGDTILRRVASILRDQTRGTDAVCRVGGEEFLIIFPQQTVEEASVCAERCRSAVENHAFNVSGQERKATISIGLAARQPDIAQFIDLLKLADQALYAAKNSGRNRVCIADPTPEPNAMNNDDTAPTFAQASARQPATPAGPGPQTPATPPADGPTGQEPAATASVARPPVDMKAVLDRCGGDASFAEAVVQRFQGQSGLEVAKVQQALAAGDADGLRRAAHSLKSMAAYMSADAAAELAGRVEGLARDLHLAEAPPLVLALSAEVERANDWLAQNASPGVARVA